MTRMMPFAVAPTVPHGARPAVPSRGLLLLLLLTLR
ncbi:hypothetical protein PANO111632_03335 [Paracoccus nototheniae]